MILIILLDHNFIGDEAIFYILQGVHDSHSVVLSPRI